MKELSLFTGLGGGIYGSIILGWQTVAYVEQDKYCQKLISQRIHDGWFHKGKIYDDLAQFNKRHAHKYKGQIDVLTGGFPCQPFSVAGKREGTSDDRYLGDEIEETISIIRPATVFFENVRGILTDPAIIIFCEMLERLGYELSAPLLLGSDDCGNIHWRKRLWIYATDPAQQSSNARGSKTTKHSKKQKSQFRNSIEQPNDPVARCKRVSGSWSEEVQRKQGIQGRKDIRSFEDLLSRPDIPEPLFCGMDDELPEWRKQLKAIGNGQDPIVMATAYQLLSGDTSWT